MATSSKLTQREKVSYAIERLTRPDVGFTRDQALGALGSLAGESGANLNTRAKRANDAGPGLHSEGIAQWNRERLTGLKNFASKNKKDMYDYKTQVDYVAHELKTTHKGAAAAVRSATTRAKAANAFTDKYEVPDPKTANKAGRRAHAETFARFDVGSTIKSPQQAADAANSGYVGLDDLRTGATPASAKAAMQAESQQKAKGPFEALFGGVSEAVGAIGGQPKAKAGATAADAPAKADDGFFGDATIGAMLGSFVGGYFGGPPGAIVGGLIGQGINKGLQPKAGVVDPNAPPGGVAGSLGRDIDGLFGGISSMFGGSSTNQMNERVDMGSGGGSRSSDRGGNRVSHGEGKNLRDSQKDYTGTNRGTYTGTAASGAGGKGSGQGIVRGESSHS